MADEHGPVEEAVYRTADDDGLILRSPTVNDGYPLNRLIAASPPLDRNSVYANLLHCTHFSDTTVVAEEAESGELIGYVTGYLHPKKEGVYFLWQVGVHERGRGRGLAKRMIRSILERDVCAGVTTLETTVTPSNKPSRALFASFARDEGAEMTEHEYFRGEHFGEVDHEREDLFRISPLSSTPAS